LKNPPKLCCGTFSDGAIAIVPYGSGTEMTTHPIGLRAPSKSSAQKPTKKSILEHNDNYWGEKPKLTSVRFAVVPDATTRALELRKRQW